MGSSSDILALAWPFAFAALIMSPSLVRGEMCGTVIRAATGGDNRAALRHKAFATFRSECWVQKKCQPEEIRSCSFATKPLDPHEFKFILQTLRMPFRLDFTVKTASSAQIALAEDPTRGSIFAEIAIGGFTNTESIIRPRACHSDYMYCPWSLASHEETGIVSSTESRPFWIKYGGGVVTVGKGGHQEAFMTWDVATYHGRVPAEVRVGIASWRNEPAEWKFYQFCR